MRLLGARCQSCRFLQHSNCKRKSGGKGEVIKGWDADLEGEYSENEGFEESNYAPTCEYKDDDWMLISQCSMRVCSLSFLFVFICLWFDL
ncbi:auxin-induced protein IAA4-like [Lotus japonicus]|uniref:auxin-induced protein IAA4-like n=1 Tax=Lotus japonicus TaxID=34305 RepID=UPI00258AB597|nr:auxin-induced protein IAA4-like [Lotus japonicus]